MTFSGRPFSGGTWSDGPLAAAVEERVPYQPQMQLAPVQAQ